MPETLKKNILAVDDNLTTLKEFNTILKDSFDVHLAKDANQAQTILYTTQIDLILLDLEMPGMSGLEFLDAIHNNTSFYYIPIIVVSAHGTGDIIVTAKKKGVSDFVVKPCNPKTLIEKIYTVLKTAKKRMSREVLARKLNILETACSMAQSSRVSEIITELEQVHCDIAIDLELAEICKSAESGKYQATVKKISAVLKDL